MHDIKSGEYCITGKIDNGMVSFFKRHDISINQISAEKHDQLNAVIGMGHFIGLALGQFSSDEQKDILSGIGSGSKLMLLVNGLAGNSPTTFRETQMDNKYTIEARQSLLDALNQYHRALSEGVYPFEKIPNKGIN